MLLANIADEPYPYARQGLDEALFLAAVIDCRPHCIDTGAQRRFRNNAPVPERCKQIILADDALAFLNEVYKKIKRLRLKGNQFGPSAQLAALGINCKFLKAVEQLSVISSERHLTGGLSLPQKDPMKKRRNSKQKKKVL